jgi:hypothetical protein
LRVEELLATCTHENREMRMLDEPFGAVEVLGSRFS